MIEALSPLLRAVAPSPTVGLMDRVRELTASGADIVNLAGGEPDMPPATAVRMAGAARLERGALSYGPVAGLAELRRGLAEELSRRHGRPYEAADVVVGVGAKQILFEALFATTSPGDEVLIPAPYWVSYPAMALLAGARPRVVETSASTGFKLNAGALRGALSPASRWLILNSPGNPTGAVYSADELRALAAVAAEHPRLLVLCDDIYEHIIFDGARHTPLPLAAPGLAARTFTCSGFSKGYAMPGLRVGYGAGPRWLIQAVTRLQSHLTSGGCVVGQAAAIAALEEAGDFPGGCREVYARRRGLMADILGACGLLSFDPPQGAFYGWIGVAGLIGRDSPDGGRLLTDQDVAEALLAEAGLAVVPGAAFGSSPHLRLSFAASDERVAEGCRRLVHFAEACTAPARRPFRAGA